MNNFGLINHIISWTFEKNKKKNMMTEQDLAHAQVLNLIKNI